MSTSPRSPRAFFPADLTPLITSGWQTNKFDKSIPFWAEVDGLQFTETSIRRKPGKTLLSDVTSTPIRGLVATEEYDTKVLYAGSLTDVYRWKQDDPSATPEVVGAGFNLVSVAGLSSWDSGSSTWDATLSTWDESVVQATSWSFSNFGTWVLGANSIGPLVIKKGNETFNELIANKLSGANITDGGTGHAVGDTYTFTGGSGIGFAGEATAVTAGIITRFKITNYGSSFSAATTLTQATTSGAGTGLILEGTMPDCLFTRVSAVHKSGPHLLAINYDKADTQHPYDVAWCSADDPDTWIAAAANSAGSLTLREASGALRCIVPLGEGTAIYTESEMFLLNYVGAPYYYGYETAMTSGVGAVSANSVVSVDRLNYGLSRRGLFMTDGNTVERLGDSEGINKLISESVSEGEYAQVCAYHNKKNTEVVWSIPFGTNQPNIEITYNYSNNTFSKRTQNVSAFLEAGVFSHAMTADSIGDLYYEDGGNSEHTTVAVTKAHDLEDPYAIKEITSIRVGKIGLGSPKVELGWSEGINDEPTFNTSDSFYIDDSFGEKSVRTSGRYLYLRLTSSDPTDSWEISNIVIKGRIRGFR
tara:strand:- start:3670 stop:5436 length:1767 start_codon:yes stop_codon:yes gene_type:complete